MTLKQNQIIAITNGKKSQVEKKITELYQELSKSDLFSGMERTYRSIDDEGIQKPSEKKVLQKNVNHSIKLFSEQMETLINTVATMDVGNTHAKADITVDGVTIMDKVPAPHIIFLEKQVEKMITFVMHLPTLSPTEEWRWNENTNCYTSEPRETTSTQKIMKARILYEATKEHPAQVESFTIDEIAGYWTTVLTSGEISEGDKSNILKRLRKLQDAIKIARETANNTEVKEIKYGTSVMSYVFPEVQ